MDGIVENLEKVGEKRKQTDSDRSFNKKARNDRYEKQQQRQQQQYNQNYQDAYAYRDEQQRRNQLPPKQNRYIVEEGLQLQV